MPQATVARIERGLHSPRIDTLDRLLEVCGVALTTIPREGVGVDRTQMRELLRLEPGERLHRAVAASRNLQRMPRITS